MSEFHRHPACLLTGEELEVMGCSEKVTKVLNQLDDEMATCVNGKGVNSPKSFITIEDRYGSE